MIDRLFSHVKRKILLYLDRQSHQLSISRLFSLFPLYFPPYLSVLFIYLRLFFLFLDLPLLSLSLYLRSPITFQPNFLFRSPLFPVQSFSFSTFHSPTYFLSFTSFYLYTSFTQPFLYFNLLCAFSVKLFFFLSTSHMYLFPCIVLSPTFLYNLCFSVFLYHCLLPSYTYPSSPFVLTKKDIVFFWLRSVIYLIDFL